MPRRIRKEPWQLIWKQCRRQIIADNYKMHGLGYISEAGCMMVCPQRIDGPGPGVRIYEYTTMISMVSWSYTRIYVPRAIYTLWRRSKKTISVSWDVTHDEFSNPQSHVQGRPILTAEGMQPEELGLGSLSPRAEGQVIILRAVPLPRFWVFKASILSIWSILILNRYNK